jgi:hypothetical protein
MVRVGRRDFASQLVVAAFALVRLALVLTGLQWTRTGRRLYR